MEVGEIILLDAALVFLGAVLGSLITWVKFVIPRNDKTLEDLQKLQRLKHDLKTDLETMEYLGLRTPAEWKQYIKNKGL